MRLTVQVQHLQPGDRLTSGKTIVAVHGLTRADCPGRPARFVVEYSYTKRRTGETVTTCGSWSPRTTMVVERG